MAVVLEISIVKILRSHKPFIRNVFYLKIWSESFAGAYFCVDCVWFLLLCILAISVAFSLLP